MREGGGLMGARGCSGGGRYGKMGEEHGRTRGGTRRRVTVWREAFCWRHQGRTWKNTRGDSAKGDRLLGGVVPDLRYGTKEATESLRSANVLLFEQGRV